MDKSCFAGPHLTMKGKNKAGIKSLPKLGSNVINISQIKGPFLHGGDLLQM
jgi:hypothetical protein